jgi:type IV secretory pathway TrbL component
MLDYKILSKLILFLSLLMFHPVFADTMCQIKSGGVLDDLVSQFGNAAHTWQNQINPLARNIFYALFGMEFMWQLTVKKVFAGDIEKLWVFFFTRAVLGLFFAKYLINVETYQAAIMSIAKIGANASGYRFNFIRIKKTPKRISE